MVLRIFLLYVNLHSWKEIIIMLQCNQQQINQSTIIYIIVKQDLACKIILNIVYTHSKQTCLCDKIDYYRYQMINVYVPASKIIRRISLKF